MNQDSRSNNSKKNIIYSVISQFLLLILVFVNRTVFINTLGADYLGVNGLYSNILTVLSLAELGLGNVMIYSLYKPILNNDKLRISALINYYKKLYMQIALVVFIIGILIVPFLPLLVNSSLNTNSLRNFYILYLLNTVFSYISVYKTTLINADQKIYVIKKYNFIFQLMQNLIQIIILYQTKNFYLYLVTQVLCTLFSNIYLSFITSRMYPFIKNKVDISKDDKKDIIYNIKNVFLYKIGVVIMNNTDNILISIIVGTVAVGYYSNYYMLIFTISNLISIIINAIFSSLGNLNASDDKDKQYNVFNILLLVFHWISAFCSICFLLLINDFIFVWIGDTYILGIEVVLFIVLNFYVSNAVNPVWMYRETFGMFKKAKYLMLIAGVINIILSIILGKLYGMAGIFAATLISKLLVIVWHEPIILYKNIFQKPVNEYFKRQGAYFLITILSSIICYFSTSFINNISFVNIIIKLIVYIVIINTMFFGCLFNSKDFKCFLNYIKRKRNNNEYESK